MTGQPDFLIKDVRIFTGDVTIERGYIAVSDGKVHAVGSSDPPPSLKGEVLSLPGHTLLPGLIDCHVHAYLGAVGCLTVSRRYGVTTVLDMHNEPAYVKELKAIAADPANFTTHADFKTSGLAATVPDGYPAKLVTDFVQDPTAIEAAKEWVQLRGPQDAEQYIADRVSQGSDYIKLMHESGKTWGWDLALPTEELQAAVVKAAHARGLKVVAHSMALSDTLVMLRVGVDGMAHTFCDAEITDEIVDLYKKNNAWCCPTLAATGSMTSDNADGQRAFAHDSRVEHIAGKDEAERLCACMGTSKGHGKLSYAVDSIKRLSKEGIDIVCGSDSVGPGKPGVGWGSSMHHEMQMLAHDVGLPAIEVLKSATSTPARRFGFPDRGLIEVGRNADLLLVEGNPTEAIEDLLNIKAVWRNGRGGSVTGS